MLYRKFNLALKHLRNQYVLRVVVTYSYKQINKIKKF